MYVRPNKKRSLLRLTWLNFFTGGRSVFFFAEKFLHANPVLQRKANLYFQEQGTVTLVPVASLPKERRCQSRPGRACVLDGWPLRCNGVRYIELLRLKLPLIVFDDDVKKAMAPVFSCFVRFLKRSAAKDSFPHAP